MWLWEKVAADPFKVLCIALAAVFLFCYAIRCYRKQSAPDLAELGGGVLSCGGVVSGVLIMLSAAFPHVSDKLPDNVLFTILVGVSLLVISGRAIWGIFK